MKATIVNEFVKKVVVHALDKSGGYHRKKIELVGTLLEKSTCRATVRRWNGKEKAGRHDLSAMPPCDN